MDAHLDQAAAIGSFFAAARRAHEAQDAAIVEPWLEILWNVFLAQEERSDPSIFVTRCSAKSWSLAGPPRLAVTHDVHYMADGSDHVTRGFCIAQFDFPIERPYDLTLYGGDHFLRDEGFRRGSFADECDHGWSKHRESPDEWHFAHRWSIDGSDEPPLSAMSY